METNIIVSMGKLTILYRYRTQCACYLFGTILPFFRRMSYQSVADAWNSEDVVWFTWIRFDLLTQVTYMCFDQSSISIVTKPPDMRNNLARCTYIIRIDSQQMQEFTFCRCESSRFPINTDFIMK